MTTDPTTPDAWVDRFAGILSTLADVVMVAGALGVFLGLYLLVKASPKGPRR